MNDHPQNEHQNNGPRQRLHPQFREREAYEYQAHQPKQDGLIINNCLIVGIVLIAFALVIVVSLVLGVWLYQCNGIVIKMAGIEVELANYKKQLNDTKLVLKNEQKKMEKLQEDVKSKQDEHQKCKIELAKHETYKERPKIEGEGVDARWKEKYEECVKNFKERSLKQQGNETANEL